MIKWGGLTKRDCEFICECDAKFLISQLLFDLDVLLEMVRECDAKFLISQFLFDLDVLPDIVFAFRVGDSPRVSGWR